MSLSTHSNDKRVCKTYLSRSKDFNKVIWNKLKKDLVFPLKFLDSLGEDNALPGGVTWNSWVPKKVYFFILFGPKASYGKVLTLV